jgi:hypothetical protein
MHIMKTTSQPSAITPGNIILVMLATTISFIGITDQKIPFLTNARVDIILIVVTGMAICSQYGIKRVASTRQWTHSLPIIGYILDNLILLITLSIFAGWNFPYIQNDQQALLAVTILAGFKIGTRWRVFSRTLNN